MNRILTATEIYNKYKWEHNKTREAREIAATLARYSNECWVDNHNMDLKRAIKLAIDNERRKWKK